MKGLYALRDDTFRLKYHALEKQVSDAVWTDLWNRWYIAENFSNDPIDVVLPGQLYGVDEAHAFAELGCEDNIPQATDGGRALGKDQARIILSACLADCSAVNWHPPEDSFFRDLAQANWRASHSGNKEVPAGWSALVNLPLESESCDRALYPWWLGAIRDFDWGLAAPDSVHALAQGLDNPEVGDWIAQTLDSHTQRHIPSLLAFVRKASDEGRWIFGMEWGT